MRKNYWLVLLCLTMMMAAGCAPSSGGRTLHPAPVLLAHTSAAMQTAGFWISHHPVPDMLVLDPLAVKDLNRRIRDDLKLVKDLAVWPDTVSGEKLRARLHKEWVDLQARGLVRLDGSVPEGFWPQTLQAMDLDKVQVQVKRRYGIVARFTDQRLLPTDEKLYAQAWDVDFDELQNSALEIGTLVVMLHHGADGAWVFAESATSAGWVKAQDVAAATDEQAWRFVSDPFVVVTVPKADIYEDSVLGRLIGTAQMGTRLPLTRVEASYAEVMVPRRVSWGRSELVPGFIPADQVHAGYLAYTPRHIIQQAFRSLHQPYGWGGMYGAQDCSRFLQQVFATVGIELPRNSGAQIQVGEPVAMAPGAVGREKLRSLERSTAGGFTLLGMKGHILLYLGMVDGRAYAIHDAWAYRQPGRGGDEIFVINRVAVSDLTLGEGSGRGSLLDRLNAIKVIK